MHFLSATFVFIGALVFANAYVARDGLEDLLDDLLDADEALTVDYGKCVCIRYGCSCTAMDDNTKITADFSVKEARLHPTKIAMIEAELTIGTKSFVKVFPANKLRDFCKTVSGKRYCFSIKVKEPNESTLLNACAKIVSPHPLTLGCFRIPLMEDNDWSSDSEEFDDDLTFVSEEFMLE